jgi:DegV family protein with EDD domain
MSKTSIGIVTEDAADLPQEILKEHQIEIASCQLGWPEGESLSGSDIYQKMREADKLGVKTFPKTSQPSPKSYLDAFKKQLEKFDKVLCITISSKLSGSHNSANQAKNFLGPEDEKRIFIIDSLNATAGQALLVLRTNELIQEQGEISEVIAGLKSLIPNIHFYAFLEDPKWLEAGGRMNLQVANWVRKFQKIHLYPFIGIKDGLIEAMGITRGKDLPEALFRQIEGKSKEVRKQGKKIRVVITHCDNLGAAEKLKEMLKKTNKTEVPFVNLTTLAIGAHFGPGSLAAAWMAI